MRWGWTQGRGGVRVGNTGLAAVGILPSTGRIFQDQVSAEEPRHLEKQQHHIHFQDGRCQLVKKKEKQMSVRLKEKGEEHKDDKGK